MGLRAQAEADLAVTLEPPGDFGTPVTLTDPAGFTGTAQIYGMTGDIGQLIDADTGAGVSGRLAHCTVRLSSLTAAGFSTIPRGIADVASKPWRVSFAGAHDPTPVEYKVKESRPDTTLGVVVLILEFYVAP